MLAPIVLFVYNRPEHTRKTLESLMQNELANQSELFVFADGPKEEVSGEGLEKIKKTRGILLEKQWCKDVHIIERKKNMGLANSVIAGVTEIINKFGRTIVLEDDLLLSKNFLRYMNDALDKFENEERVMQISGYMFPVDLSDTKTDAFFLPFTSSWGWATWKRSWDLFDESANGLEELKKNKEARKKFNLNGAQNYYKMLKKQKEGKVDSWAIRFYLSVFLRNGLVVFPKKTLVNNIGFDGSGMHCRLEIKQDGIKNDFDVLRFDEVGVNNKAQDKIEKFTRNQNRLFVRIYNTIIKKIRC